MKAYDFSESAIQGVVRFVATAEPGLRVRDLRRYHVERLRTHYDGLDYAPRTINKFTRKLS